MQMNVFSVHSSLPHMKLTVNILKSPILENGGLGKFNHNMYYVGLNKMIIRSHARYNSSIFFNLGSYIDLEVWEVQEF